MCGLVLCWQCPWRQRETCALRSQCHRAHTFACLGLMRACIRHLVEDTIPGKMIAYSILRN